MSFLFTVHNWRCFDTASIKLPNQSTIIIDNNGAGKTSMLSAFYSLFTGKSWPQTKFNQHLKQGREYFGLSTTWPDWFISGQTRPSGKLAIKSVFPDTPITVFNQLVDFQKPVQILTYLPTDNLWLGLARTKKLAILDEMVANFCGTDHHENIKLLEKSIKGKNNLIRNFTHHQQIPDEIVLNFLNQEIFKFSVNIWKARKTFIDYFTQEMVEFNSWIANPLQNLQLIWKATQTDIFKLKVDLKSDFWNQPNWAKIWEKELLVGKVLYGAQRDDFSFSNNHVEIQEILSRGEMRLFVLYSKAKSVGPGGSKIWWLLDDVFNELDEKRESIIEKKLLANIDYYLVTGTKKTILQAQEASLSQLTIVK